MITNFKLFENKPINLAVEYWFVDIFDLQFVESVYEKIKKLNIKGYFFPSTVKDVNKNIKDIMYIFIHTSKKIKIKEFPNWLESNYNEFDNKYDLINIEDWLKEYQIKQKAKKYNIL